MTLPFNHSLRFQTMKDSLSCIEMFLTVETFTQAAPGLKTNSIKLFQGMNILALMQALFLELGSYL